LKIGNPPKASGVSPWQITSPALRLASYALIAHLIINILVQPFAFREMRHTLTDVRNDIAAKMVQAGSFISPTDGLTLYAQDVHPNGYMVDILVYDNRNSDDPVTYMAKNGYLHQQNGQTRFILNTASYQIVKEDKSLDILEVERDEIDLSDLLNASAPTHLKTFLIKGTYQRTGYTRPIAICAIIGFSLYLISFALSAASEDNPALNKLQYALPLTLSLICLTYLLYIKPPLNAQLTPALQTRSSDGV